MLTKRIIACLDIKNGRIVKGVGFKNLIDGGDPVEVSQRYEKEGIDELVLLDITASHEGRKIMKKVIQSVAEIIFMPFSVGGGLNSIKDIHEILRLGADKISLNTAAIQNPQLIQNASRQFGSQCIIVAIDAKKKKDGSYKVYSHGGRYDTKLDVIFWAQKVASLGAGEILLTSMDNDGNCKGYEIEITRKVSESVSIPVIASGGAGKIEDFYQLFSLTQADAVLAASVFHFQKISIAKLKQSLSQKGIPIRKT